ncbi:MAG: hypothetical protein M8467_05155 [Anaerolineae bacterium]|nr:hypothetical protein [Anaerolineae bacterium]
MSRTKEFMDEYGRFNPLNGQVLLGPPPSPLPAYRLQVEGESVYVESLVGA